MSTSHQPHVFLLLKAIHVEEYGPVYRVDRQRTVNASLLFISPSVNMITNAFWFTDTSFNSRVAFTARDKLVHSLLLQHAGGNREPGMMAEPPCSMTKLHVPLNPVTHFSQLGLAGRERCTCCPNNWDCKVNVRRKLRTPTLPLPPTQPNPATQQQAFISQLAAHQQISHQHSLELLLLLLLVVTGFPPIESDVNKDSWVTSQRDVRRVWYEISLQEQRNDHRH